MKRSALLLLASLFFLDGNSQKMDELIKANLIEATFKKVASNQSIDGSEHRGKCLSVTIQNLSTKPLAVELENGYHIENMTQENQDLITVDRMIVRLEPKQQKDILLNAFCIQKNDRSPSSSDSFRCKGKSTASMEALCVWLQQQQLYNHSAQQAIWCLSDRENIEYIYDTHKDTVIENKLVSLVARLSAKPLPERKRYTLSAPRVLYYPIEFDGIYSKHITSHTTTGFYILDSTDKVVSVIMQDDTEQRQGTVKYSYKYRGQYPKGTYYLKMKQNNVWTLMKEIRVSEG